MRLFFGLLRPSGLVPEGLFLGKGKEQDWVSCETSCSKTARAHVRRKLPCACSFSEAGGGGLFPAGIGVLSCTGVLLPLYGQDHFPFMGVEGKQTNENRKEKQDEGKVHNGEVRQQGQTPVTQYQ